MTSKRPRQSDEISSETIVVYSIDPDVSSSFLDPSDEIPIPLFEYFFFSFVLSSPKLKCHNIIHNEIKILIYFFSFEIFSCR